MQLIETTDWTEVQNLSEDEIYLLQANGLGHNKLVPVKCYWAQCETRPQDFECDVVVTENIKLKAGVPVFVKTDVVPIRINVLKVEQ